MSTRSGCLCLRYHPLLAFGPPDAKLGTQRWLWISKAYLMVG